MRGASKRPVKNSFLNFIGATVTLDRPTLEVRPSKMHLHALVYTPSFKLLSRLKIQFEATRGLIGYVLFVNSVTKLNCGLVIRRGQKRCSILNSVTQEWCSQPLFDNPVSRAATSSRPLFPALKGLSWSSHRISLETSAFQITCSSLFTSTTFIVDNNLSVSIFRWRIITLSQPDGDSNENMTKQ